MSETNAEEVTQNLSLASCSTCRRMHKRCDRKLPKWHHNCVYEGTQKRGPKPRYEQDPYPHPKAVQNPTYQVKPTPQQPELVPIAVDVLFDFPVLPRDKLNSIIEYIQQEESGSPIFEPKPTTEEVALVYAIQSMVSLNWGQVDNAERCHEKARELVAPLFDQMLSNFCIAACYVYLGMYTLIHKHDIDRTMFYLTNVKTFVDIKKQDPNPDKRLNLLMFGYYMCMGMLAGECDTHHIMKAYISRFYFLQEFYKDALQQGMPVSAPELVISETGFSQKEVEKIDLDLYTNSHENYPFDIYRLEYLGNKFSALFDRLVGVIPEHILQRRKLMVSFVVNAAILEYYMREEDDVQTRTQADHLVSMTKSTYFTKTMGIVSVAMGPCARAYMKLLEKSTDEVDTILILQSLKDTYDVLKMITMYSKIVQTRFGDLTTTIEQVLAQNSISVSETKGLPVFANTLENFKNLIQEKQENSPLLDEQISDLLTFDTDEFFKAFL